MSHTKYIINCLIITSLTSFLVQILDILIFPQAHIIITFQSFLNNSSLIIVILISVLLSGLIGGILGFIFYPFFYTPDQMQVDFPANMQAQPQVINTDNVNKTHSTDETSINTHDDSQEGVPLKPDEAALHNENIEKKDEFDEKLSSGTFEDPNVVVENPGQKLVDNPATLFNPVPNEDPKKPHMNDDDYARKLYALGVPKPGAPSPPPMTKS